MPHDPADDPTTPAYADRMLQRGRDAHRAGEPLANSQHIGHDRGEMLWRTGWYLADGDTLGEAAPTDRKDESVTPTEPMPPRSLVFTADGYGAWRYHLARPGRRPACGIDGANEAGDLEHAEALRLLLGHTEGDSTWCPVCLGVLAQLMPTPEGTDA